MNRIFANFPALTAELASDLLARIAGAAGMQAQLGFSNQSCSAYVKVDVVDEDGDYGDEFKVRFSDHADRYGSDITIRIDELTETVEDACGDYDHITIEDWRYAEALDRAHAAILAKLEA